jgi:hypothetical protein
MIRTSIEIGFTPSHPDEFLFLDDAQELRLHGQGHVSHLVEKQSPPVRALQEARPRRDGAGKGFPLVTEQLVRQQLFGEGPAVDRQKAVGSSPAFLVHGPGDQLLARAGLARDEDMGIRSRKLGDHFLQTENRRTAADQPVPAANLGAYGEQLLHLGAEPDLLESLGHDAF